MKRYRAVPFGSVRRINVPFLWTLRAWESHWILRDIRRQRPVGVDVISAHCYSRKGGGAEHTMALAG
jgi:hypothetical protein